MFKAKWANSIYISVPQTGLPVHPPVVGYLDQFRFLAVMNNVLWTFVYMSLCGNTSWFPVWIPRSGTAALRGPDLQKLPNAFQSGCDILLSLWEALRFQFLHILASDWLCALSHSNGCVVSHDHSVCSHMTHDNEHLFMCILAVSLPSWMKWLEIFCPFCNWIILFLLWYKIFLNSVYKYFIRYMNWNYFLS